MPKPKIEFPVYDADFVCDECSGVGAFEIIGKHDVKHNLCPQCVINAITEDEPIHY